MAPLPPTLAGLSYISADKYSLVADAEKGETIEIDRHTNQISLVGKSPPVTEQP